MLIHNLKYSLRILLKSKALIFWTFAFPIILGTFFNLAFSNIEKSEKLDIINIAIVDTVEYRENEIFKESFKVLSDENNENRLFNTKYVTQEEAKELLLQGDIAGYLIITDSPKVVVSTSGIDQTILKYTTEEIIQTSKIVENISTVKIQEEIAKGNIRIDYEKIYKEVLNLSNNQEANIEDISNNNLSYTMIEYYTLIAMACLYGGILAMVAVNKNLANMSSCGKRLSVTPVEKWKLIFSSLVVSYITQLIGIALLFIYTVFVLKVNYGNNLPFIVLTAIVGSLAGLSIGTVIATIIKSNENTKTGILISITMLGCFFAGMMGITMKYVIDKNIPIINKINPAGMITDAYYALYYYDTLDRFYFNIISLIIFSFIMIGISVYSLRRQKYDNI